MERNKLEKKHKIFFIVFIMSSSKDLHFFDFLFLLENKKHISTQWSFKSGYMTIFKKIWPTNSLEKLLLLEIDDFFG